jgi:hypothetical protein
MMSWIMNQMTIVQAHPPIPIPRVVSRGEAVVRARLTEATVPFGERAPESRRSQR